MLAQIENEDAQIHQIHLMRNQELVCTFIMQQDEKYVNNDYIIDRIDRIDEDKTWKYVGFYHGQTSESVVFRKAS